MDNDRPIVFTLQEQGRYDCKMYNLITKDPRGSSESVWSVYADELFKTMADISEVLNNNGYAVLFEVDWYESYERI